MDNPVIYAVGMHYLLALLAVWPALRILRRGGLPALWVVWLIVPLFGWLGFAYLLAMRPWPAVPALPKKMHPREALRQANADIVARRRAAGLEPD